ncbi:hypothetical protein KO488_00815 [Poseidonibacter lekithochrous]|uniref:hypothetical protein n=1 Tax=Poseidonibacter TaxID=2321187 RepID=UPI001C08E45A|nr:MULTISPECIES: hypothetical protein [Poseidonibacter]MBU3013277.1 hypothetical protein [Poseidonibacter lekithochrous]MDO6826574.1 hypothetical protein [Poseidonibacter sp. 1_MG-2023]
MLNQEQISLKLEKEYKHNLRMYFNEDFSLHKTMNKYFNTILENIKNNKTPISILFEELADFYLMTSIYANTFCEDKEKVSQFLSTSPWYSYKLISIFNKNCNDSHSSVLLMRKAIYLWSSLFLISWNKKAIEIGSELIDSLNNEGSIIRYGCRLYPEAWFLIDLYSIAFNKEYDKKRADYPENMDDYKNILNDWDTNDLTKVDLFVSNLIELHLLIEENKDNDENTSEYMLFDKSVMKLYVYEVFIFLGIRKEKGLKNPIEFSHPLMNTDITKIYLDNKEPLSKPKELPYAKELIVKLQKKCPDITLDEDF